ncbi:hypothetical protein ACFX15_046101 [Malus domestica]
MHKVMYQFHLKLTCSFGLGQVQYKPYSKSPPGRRGRLFAEEGIRQGKQSDFQASKLDRRLILELGWRVFWFPPEYKAGLRI